MEFQTLNNGIKIPVLGFGVWQIFDQKECQKAVEDALSVGYRLIDTASLYRNEEAVGRAIKASGIPREDIFLTSKAWISQLGYEDTKLALKETLRKLDTDYLDLYLIHQPFGDLHGAWRAMIELKHEELIRAIGVSNFQAGRFFDFAHYADVKPMVNQLQCNSLAQQKDIQPLLDETETKTMAWGPLGGQGVDGIVNSDMLTAIGQKYGKSAAQVALRWLTQRGIVAIPKSSHIERMQQNFDIFDFSLTKEDMDKIATMNQSDAGFRDFTSPDFVKYLIENYG